MPPGRMPAPVPDSLQEPAAFLQRRVATFARVSCVIFTGSLLADLSVTAAGEAPLSSTRVAGLSVVLTYAAIWLRTRAGRRSARESRTLELSGLAVTALGFSVLPVFPPVPGAGGVLALLLPIPLAVTVTLRAALIPSATWLSVLVTLLWGGLSSVTAMLGWENVDLAIPGQPPFPTWLFPLTHNLTATVGLAVVSGVVSHVVHGLQTQVREAMQLGQYTLEAKIGEGGMGAVYRARHALLRRPTAVKLLPPEKSSEEAIARFEREVQQTSRLSHPNTVAIYDFGRTPAGVFYYAMEYLDGVSLGELVSRFGPLPEARVIHALRQSAEALAEAHAAGLVHRDIKPDNLVLCERGGVFDTVKVVDFGLVKHLEAPSEAAVSVSGKIQGTPLYMAPEALTRPDDVDGRTDLYSLGATAYHLLAGEPPFRGQIVEVFAAHLHTRPTPPSERRGEAVDPALEAIVTRLLEKDPSDRFASAEALVEALAGCRAAKDWTRARARAWWDAHGAEVATRAAQPPSAEAFAPTLAGRRSARPAARAKDA